MCTPRTHHSTKHVGHFLIKDDADGCSNRTLVIYIVLIFIYGLQEQGAAELPPDFAYPTMDQLSEVQRTQTSFSFNFLSLFPELSALTKCAPM